MTDAPRSPITRFFCWLRDHGGMTNINSDHRRFWTIAGIAHVLLTLLGGCGFGPDRTYEVDLTTGQRRCVVATGYESNGERKYTFFRNGQAVGTLTDVSAIVAVEKCEER